MDKRFLPANANRFELEQDSQVGYLIIEIDGQDWITLGHTEVPQALRGQGFGAKFLRMAFEYAEANHLTVEPICPFAISFVAKHPEVQPFVGKRSATGRGPSEVN
ncbi:MAG: GNAT family N-acetyltransferase [Bryobacteraceae bacterium]